MSEEIFIYIKNKTREVCRNCGSHYSDFFYVDKSGFCDDCSVNTAHLGFTNLPKNWINGRHNRKIVLNRIKK